LIFHSIVVGSENQVSGLAGHLESKSHKVKDISAPRQELQLHGKFVGKLALHNASCGIKWVGVSWDFAASC